MTYLVKRPVGVNFDDVFGASLTTLIDSFWSNDYQRSGNDLSGFLNPNADVREDDNAYKVSLALPGLTKDELKISYKDKVLTVEAKQKSDKEDGAQGYVYREIRQGDFKRSFKLPKGVNEDDISAIFENGLLVVTVPKAEEVKPKEINISLA
jgi:HSP20 family protein